jgi:MFS transporter, MFS domain-containing protein family, molybdate-anion transporter
MCISVWCGRRNKNFLFPMIDPSEYIFYVGYLLLCLLAILLQIKLQSVENILITTTEFKAFQFHYLFGYLGIILGEILSVGSFYSTLVSTSSSHGASLTDQQITQLFLVSILSTTIFSLLNEVMDLCSKRMKCILSGILFSLATLTLFSSHFDILIFGRILYGGGSVLLHSGFDSYLIHEHNSQGFPDDWLNNTFGRLVHSMVVVTMISGPFPP